MNVMVYLFQELMDTSHFYRRIMCNSKDAGLFSPQTFLTKTRSIGEQRKYDSIKEIMEMKREL